METAQEMEAKIVGKAAEDAEFRARLLSDPKATIEQELSVTIPASMSIDVHEDSATTVHLTLPPTAALSEADLQSVAAAGRRVIRRDHTGRPIEWEETTLDW